MTAHKYYSLSKIQKKGATYNIVFGERSNGKTYATLEYCLKRWVEDGTQFVYLRRWAEDVKQKRASQLFAGLDANGVLEKLTYGRFTHVHYAKGKFYAANVGEDGKTLYSESDVIGFPKALSEVEHDKSTAYPDVRIIVFDEFITAKTYFQDEFVVFMNTISTIVRLRGDVEIYMLGNTVNKFCPYFNEMGLYKVPTQRQGSIDLYSYGESNLKVAVEYCQENNGNNKKAASSKYFAFNNPKLAMITGGAWELSIYPHLPYKYRPMDVLAKYFIIFNGDIFQGNIISVGDEAFTYIHIKTTPLQDNADDIIFTFDSSPKPNYVHNILKVKLKFQDRILWFFQHNKVYYQDNNVGNSIDNYFKTCKQR